MIRAKEKMLKEWNVELESIIKDRIHIVWAKNIFNVDRAIKEANVK